MGRDGPWSAALRRRTLLTCAAAALAAAGVSSCAPGTGRARGTRPEPGGPNVRIERVWSDARNREVDLVTMLPAGARPEGLPACLLLHGRFGEAEDSVRGIPGWLTAAAARGMRPYAVLAVDGGGNNYWHEHPDDDPMGMLLDEVPGWLRARGLGGGDGRPFAASGISMGGFGALLYARRRRERGGPLRAAAVISPALLTSWQQMRKRRAFTGRPQWAALDPLRHVDALGDLPLGVWCGTGDPFIEGTREFIRLAGPEIASTTPGGHNRHYYRKALPEAIRFLGSHAPSRVPLIRTGG